MDFYKRMKLVCEQIPEGKVASYGQIALLCGKPKNARQVGYALRQDRAGSNIPAYRIVNGSGYLSGAQAFATPELQRSMLGQEGIEVVWTKRGWKVDMELYGWKNSMEEAEILYQMFKTEGI